MRLPKPHGMLFAACCIVLYTTVAVSALLAPQNPSGTGSTSIQGLDVVTVDITNRTVDGTLPFDVPFQLRGQVPATARRVDVAVARTDGATLDTTDWPALSWEHTPGIQSEEFRITVPPLDVNGYYRLTLTLTMALAPRTIS